MVDKKSNTRGIQEDYLMLRKLQKRAREEMWHVFSHHPDLEQEWDRRMGGCLGDIKNLIEWEPDD